MTIKELLPISEAFRRIYGTRQHPSTLWRWQRRGVKGIKLSGVLMKGRTPVISMEDALAFVQAVTDARNSQMRQGIASSPPESAFCTTAAKRAAEELRCITGASSGKRSTNF